VPLNDRPGPSEPEHVYSIFADPKPAAPAQAPTKPGFYVGGNIYSDWASVPDSYKEVNSQQPDPRRASGTIFRFSW
jgi:hypothetical protein